MYEHIIINIAKFIATLDAVASSTRSKNADNYQIQKIHYIFLINDIKHSYEILVLVK